MTARLDVLFTHAWLLANDPHEQEIMRPFPPLGIQYLVAYLRSQGVSATDWYDPSFDPDLSGLRGHIAASDPRVVGLYGHTVTRPVAAPFVAEVADQGRRVIAGGPDPVQYLDAYFSMGVEVVVIGEGEQTVAELVAHLRANNWQWNRNTLEAVPGIAFQQDGRTIRTPPRPLLRPLSSLPWPARERRDLDRYFAAWRARHGETALSLVTSRGCPYKCTWCSKQVYGDTFRRRDVEDVIAEMVHLKTTFDPDQFWFADDLFTTNKRWVRRFSDAVVAEGLQTPFYIIARPETLDPALCASLKRAGCYRVYLSAESGAQHVLDAMKKGDSVEHIRTAARRLRAVGIELGVFVMLGYPGEARQDVEATLQMLHEIEPDVTLLSVAHPMKGTAFYEAVEDRLLPADPTWVQAHGGRLPFVMDHHPRFYDYAQRLIWAETELVQRLRKGRFDRRTASLVVKAPALRLATRFAAELPAAPTRGLR